MTAGRLLGFYRPDLNLKNFMDINHILDMALLFDFRTSKSPLLDNTDTEYHNFVSSSEIII